MLLVANILFCFTGFFKKTNIRSVSVPFFSLFIHACGGDTFATLDSLVFENPSFCSQYSRLYDKILTYPMDLTGHHRKHLTD